MSASAEFLQSNEVRRRLLSLYPQQFESFVATLWERNGFVTETTTQGSDGGVDVYARKSFPYPRTVAVQAKRYSRNNTVGVSAVREYSSLHNEQEVDDVVIVTTSSFTSGAKEEAVKHNVKLVDLDALSRLVSVWNAEQDLRRMADKPMDEDVDSGDTEGVVDVWHGLSAGDLYTKDDIEDAFDTGFGNMVPGINRRRDGDGNLYGILFSSEQTSHYTDGSADESDVMQYIGSGRKKDGDQTLDNNRNELLARSIDEDIPLYFFRREEYNEAWEYQGEVDVVEYTTKSQDGREVLVFHLAPSE